MNGTGRGGKSFQDRTLAAKVRTKGLNDVYAVLTGKKEVEKWSELKKQIVMRMAPNLLPRLNAGRDDTEPLFPHPIYNGQSSK
mgnify:CR=1 FL=1